MFNQNLRERERERERERCLLQRYSTNKVAYFFPLSMFDIREHSSIMPACFPNCGLATIHSTFKFLKHEQREKIERIISME